MGVAAYNRGSASISKQFDAEQSATRSRYLDAKALQVSEGCNAFVRQALDLIVDPKGLRGVSVETAKKSRGWAKRNEALIAAHNAWVNVDYRYVSEYHPACVARAKAAYALLAFALGTWSIPKAITVPRSAQ